MDLAVAEALAGAVRPASGAKRSRPIEDGEQMLAQQDRAQQSSSSWSASSSSSPLANGNQRQQLGAAAAAPQGKRRGRPPRGPMSASSFSASAAAASNDGGDLAAGPTAQSYASAAASAAASGVVDDELAEEARRIAADMGTSFDDEDAVSKLKKLTADAADAQRRLLVGEAALSSNPADAPSAAAFKEAQATLASSERQISRASAAAAQRFRRNVRDAILRVTLQKDVSDVNERAGGGAPGGDLLYVQPPRMVCERCHNSDETLFWGEYRSGDVTCVKCGLVALQHAQYDGDWSRSFEGEDTTSQIGDRPNALLSNSHNLRTAMRLSSGVSKESLRQLQLVQEVVEMNQAVFGSDANERRTREGYKDKQKQRAFERLAMTGQRLRIGEGVVDRAKVIFAAFRDNREHLTGLEESIASCLVAAAEEAQLLRRAAGEEAARRQQASRGEVAAVGGPRPLAREEAEGGSSRAPSAALLPGGTAESAAATPAAAAAASAAAAPAPVAPAAAPAAAAAMVTAAAPFPAPAPLSRDPTTAVAIAAAAVAKSSRETAQRALVARKRATLVRGQMLALSGPEEEEEDGWDGGRKHNGPQKFSIRPLGSPAAGSATAPAAVTDAFVDALYARAGEREVNPDVEEREEYRAPS